MKFYERFDPFPAPAPLDAAIITTDFWQGARPCDDCDQPLVGVYRRLGIGLIILCDDQWQPEPQDFDVPVLHAPFDDSHRPKPEELALAERASRIAATAHRNGKRVLVTCQAGLNRSGLVMALALRDRFNMTGKTAADRVRTRRDGGLCNTAFYEYLVGLKRLRK